MMVTLTLIATSIGILVSIVTAGKLVIDMVFLRKDKLEKDFKFAEDFFTKLKTNPEMHPFVKERGYHVIANGDKTLSVNVIEYILNLQNPSSSLRDYVLAKHYLKFEPNSDSSAIIFKEKFSKDTTRKIRKRLYMVGYFIFAIAALSPAFIVSSFKSQPTAWLILFGMTILIFGFPAFSALKEYERIHRGEYLVKNQK